MLICADHFTLCSSYLAIYTLWYMMDLADTHKGMCIYISDRARVLVLHAVVMKVNTFIAK